MIYFMMLIIKIPDGIFSLTLQIQIDDIEGSNKGLIRRE